jgi:type IV pilus assembly protein PilC
MNPHRYRAMASDGRRVRGELDAIDLRDLEQRLQAMGLVLINGEAIRLRWWTRAKVPRRELINFCFHFEQLLAAGVPPFEALTTMRDATTHARTSVLISTLLTDVERGHPLSEAIARPDGVFAPALVALLKAGEQAGRLSDAIREIGAALEREEALVMHARRIAIYPAIVAALLLLALVVALVHVVPEMEKLFRSSGEQLPLQTRVLLALSALVTKHGWLMLLGTGGLAATLQWQLARSEPARVRAHRLLLSLPFVGGILRDIGLARFASTLASLYAAGVPVIDALHIAEDTTGNLALRNALRDVTRQVERGRPLAAAFETASGFPALLTRMVRVGEQTGALDRALDNVALLCRRDVDNAIGRLQAAIEPALTVMLGALLLWIASAILGPIYGLITRLPL